MVQSQESWHETCLPLKVIGISGRPVHLHLREADVRDLPDEHGSDVYVLFPAGIQYKCACPKTLQYLIMGHCLFAVFVIDGHFLTVHRMTADRRIDGAFVFFEVSIDDCPVSSRDRMNFQLFCKIERWARSFLQTRREPVVSRSMRWTMPGRMTPLMPERLSPQWYKRALTRVPL